MSNVENRTYARRVRGTITITSGPEQEREKPRMFQLNSKLYNTISKSDEDFIRSVIPSSGAFADYRNICKKHGISADIITINNGAPPPGFKANFNYSFMSFPDPENIKKVLRQFRRER